MSNQTSELSPELRARVIGIIADVLEVEPEQITEQSDFIEDHEADSLAIIEIFSQLQKELGVRVPPEELKELNDLGTTIDLVARHLPEGVAGV